MTVKSRPLDIRTAGTRVGLAVTLALLSCPVAAQPTPESAAAASAERFYLLSFDQAPAAEVIEAVVVQTLGADVVVDPDIDAAITFKAEGWYTRDSLLRDLGTALMDRQVALLQSPQGDLTVVQASDVATELAGGGILLTLEGEAATPPVAAISAGNARREQTVVPDTPAPARTPPSPAIPFLLGLITGGAGAGAAAWALWRRRTARLTPTVTARPKTLSVLRTDPVPADPDLVIPRFEPRR